MSSTQTQIQDIYNPSVFSGAEQEAQIEKNAFINSGVMVEDPRLTQMASVGGNIGQLPFFKPLGSDEPNYSSDLTGDNVETHSITSSQMNYRVAHQNQSWSVMDLATDLALNDPVSAITNRIGAYWATSNEMRLIQSAVGILSNNIANNEGDMLFSVASSSEDAVQDDERVSHDAILDALQTAGDHQDGFGAIAMHSAVYNRLRKQQLIDFVRDADNNTLFKQYGDLRVIVDDSLPAIKNNDQRFTYTTILFGNGSVVSGSGRVSFPSELDRNPGRGNGGGQTNLYSRRADIIHPLGFNFTGSQVTGRSASFAELAVAENWERVWDRKNVPLAFLQTNG